MSQHQTTDARQTILIIDDNPVNLRVLSDHLRQRGIIVVAAQDGEEGLERARLVKPDLILLDVMMPGIDGLETCRRLKASDATREIPVIFKTALTDKAIRIAGFEAGGVDYVTSPIQIEEVMARVQTHLTLHRVKQRLEQKNLDLQQEVEVRERAEKALEQARDELEERVQQRTAELRAEITERKRAEETIEKERKRMEVILSSLNTGLSLINPDMTIAWVNQKVREMFPGRGEPEGQICHVFYESRPTICDGCGTVQTFVDGKVCESEQIVPATGRWYYIISQPIKDTTGRVVNVLEGITDITERKRAEETQTRLNRELRAISNCNQTLLRATDEQTLISEICRIVCEEAGYSSAWVGYAEQDEAKTVRPVAWAGIEQSYLGTAGISWSEQNEFGRGPTGTAIRSGTTCYNQDFASDAGSSPWRESALQRGYRSCIALPLKGEHGSAFGALTIYSSEPNAFSPEEIRMLEELAGDLAFGITVIQGRIERERTEKTLALRSFALNSVREGALLTDEQGRLRDVNDWGCSFLGYSREQLLEMGVPDLDPEMSAERWPEHWTLLKAQRSLTFERVLRSNDGRIANVEVSANYFEYEGVGYNLALTRDITERKRAEEEKAKLQEQLHQAQKMEAIGQLAGGVAHDFNNILGIINGYSEILLNRRQLDQEQRSQVEEILAAGQRAASLTRQLLAFSRKLVLQPKVLNLNSVIEGFEKMLRRLIGDEIEVRTVLAPNLSAVIADPNQMEQVLLNFCINARDAMPNGGRITIETANVEVNDATAPQHFLLIKDGHLTCPVCGDDLYPGSYVRLSVSDTGIGMNQETMSHIFEPFFTTKGSERGTGLGLATVFGIVKQSGGHVLVSSEPGRGATFRVYLPVVSRQIREREQISIPQQSLRGTETVLLVEDAAPLRTLYRQILEDRGYTVLEAADGERAIEVAEQYQGNLSLLLSDVSLPKMNGPALAKILLQQRPTMKVLFISGHSDDVVAGSDHLLAPGTGFLQKPFSAEELFRTLREILDPHEPEKAT